MSVQLSTKKSRRRKCSECGKLKHDVFGRQRLCERCEEGKSYCKVCDEWTDHSFGDGCRHAGWSTDSGCEAGCGTHDLETKDHHHSFLELLKRLQPLETYGGKPLLPELRALLSKNNFWTQWHGPLIGCAPALSFRYEGAKGWFGFLCEIPARTQEGWGKDAIESMQLGMAWLTSLDHHSRAANKITVDWIDEFSRVPE